MGEVAFVPRGGGKNGIHYGTLVSADNATVNIDLGGLPEWLLVWADGSKKVYNDTTFCFALHPADGDTLAYDDQPWGYRYIGITATGFKVSANNTGTSERTFSYAYPK